MTLRLISTALTILLAGCSSSAPSRAQPPHSSDPPFTIAELAKFDAPWALAFLPGGGALVTEKAGHLKYWAPGRASSDVRGIPRVAYGGQGGLLDVVLSPNFAADRLIYLTYSEPSPNGGSGLALARARLLADDDAPRLDGLQVIWRDPAGGDGGQFGAIVAFAPDGRSLFLSSGERQRFTPAQDPSQPLGKILHLTLDGKPDFGRGLVDERLGAPTVTITDPPEDTEAAKHTAGRSFTWPGPNHTPAETWSMGHRNPYGLVFDAEGRLWETEMGPRGGDELNLILRGKNYGWPIVSNGDNYDGLPIPDHRPGDGFEPPKLWWNPSISPSSLLIYSGQLFPQWRGSGFIGALSGQALIRVTFNGDTARKADQWDMGARIRWVGQGPDGAIYLLEDEPSGRLLRLTPSTQTRR